MWLVTVAFAAVAGFGLLLGCCSHHVNQEGTDLNLLILSLPPVCDEAACLLEDDPRPHLDAVPKEEPSAFPGLRIRHWNSTVPRATAEKMRQLQLVKLTTTEPKNR